MRGQLLENNAWLAISIWVALYCSDYYLTLVGARMRRGGAQKHLQHEGGYELTPYFRKDIAALRWFSPRFVLALAWSSLLIWLLWELTAYLQRSGDVSLLASNAFPFVLGGLFLLEAAVHLRHFRNLCLFAYASRSQGIRGQLSLSLWLSLRVSAAEIAGFAALFFFCFLVSGSPFFLGGGTTCLVTSFKHLRLSIAERRTSEPSSREGEPSS